MKILMIQISPFALLFIKILLNFLGIVSFFLNRFDGRKDKTKEPSIVFWMKDNWVQLVNILIWDLALMVLAVFGGLQIDFTKLAPSLPDWITIGGDMAICFVIGLIGAYSGYTLIKKKADESKIG